CFQNWNFVDEALLAFFSYSKKFPRKISFTRNLKIASRSFMYHFPYQSPLFGLDFPETETLITFASWLCECICSLMKAFSWIGFTVFLYKVVFWFGNLFVSECCEVHYALCPMQTY
ncbi:hypothetical protein Tcan_01089, partial [Toxocara canis]